MTRLSNTTKGIIVAGIVGTVFIIAVVVFLIVNTPASPAIINKKDEGEEGFEIVLQGSLKQYDANNWGYGSVYIIEKEDGSNAVYFDEVNIASSVDERVYLSNNTDFVDVWADPGDYYDLGNIPSLTGTFEIKIPGSIDIYYYKSVLVYCGTCNKIVTYANLYAVA